MSLSSSYDKISDPSISITFLPMIKDECGACRYLCSGRWLGSWWWRPGSPSCSCCQLAGQHQLERTNKHETTTTTTNHQQEVDAGSSLTLFQCWSSLISYWWWTFVLRSWTQSSFVARCRLAPPRRYDWLFPVQSHPSPGHHTSRLTELSANHRAENLKEEGGRTGEMQRSVSDVLIFHWFTCSSNDLLTLAHCLHGNWPPFRLFWLRMNPSQQASRLQPSWQKRWASEREVRVEENTWVLNTPDTAFNIVILSKLCCCREENSAPKHTHTHTHTAEHTSWTELSWVCVCHFPVTHVVAVVTIPFFLITSRSEAPPLTLRVQLSES